MPCYLNGKGLHSVHADGTKIVDDNFYLIFNTNAVALDFMLPSDGFSSSWKVVMDTNVVQPQEEPQVFTPQSAVKVAPRSIVLLQGDSAVPTAENNNVTAMQFQEA